ncbi:MAG TPA: type II toxin-antitoxin system prevent-host-death family antitoxin [Candidatus Limnocylindrales bacterium]|nr:type II toxin-antitoxin system prevent-host-death family antitoxin [Candidatus Limnocylindrales bacterium]
MKVATVTEAKNHLSSLLDRVKAGERILIAGRGVPVARLEPIAAGPDPTGRLERLERAGILRRGVRPPPVDVLGRPAPRVPAGGSVVEALLEERRRAR